MNDVILEALFIRSSRKLSCPAFQCRPRGGIFSDKPRSLCSLPLCAAKVGYLIRINTAAAGSALNALASS